MTGAVDRKSQSQPVNSIFDAILNIPAAASSQDLSRRLTTVYKLLRVGSYGPLTSNNISAKPLQRDILKTLNFLANFKARPINNSKLIEVLSVAIKH